MKLPGFSTRDPVRIAQELIAADRSDAAHLADLIATICSEGLWRTRKGPRRTRFENLAQFVVARPPHGLGVQTDDALRRLRSALFAKRLYREWIGVMEGVVRRPGHPRKNVASSEHSSPVFTRSRSSSAIDRILPRLLREYPDLFEKVVAGTLSVHRAGIQAGIVRQPAKNKQLRFGAIDFVALSSVKAGAQRRLLCEVFDAVGLDAQCALMAWRLEGALGLNMAQKWRARASKDGEQPQT